MTQENFHIGKNGPAQCRAQYRACRYSDFPHGTEQEVTVIWEKSQEEEHGDRLLGGVSSKDVNKKVDLANDELRTRTVQTLSYSRHYESANKNYRYKDEEVAIAMKVASQELSSIGYTEVEKEDEEWSSNGFSSVRRLELKDGTRGYFKSVKSNSESSEGNFREFGTNSLTAAVNEVNAYRMAKLMGEGYENLVPETSFTVYDNQLGTLQRESVEMDEGVSAALYSDSLREDYRKAVIYDFVVGNLDRHTENFIYSRRGEDEHIVLIDNSFTFTDHNEFGMLNAANLADNNGVGSPWRKRDSDYRITGEDEHFTEDEKAVLHNVRKGIKSWMDESTITEGAGNSLISRVDALLDKGKLICFSEWYDEETDRLWEAKKQAIK